MRQKRLIVDSELVDKLGETVQAQSTAPSCAQFVMGEAIEHLQGRQCEVYLLVMREDKSLAEAGEILGITKATAQVYLGRAIKFIEAYCRQAIKGGRV